MASGVVVEYDARRGFGFIRSTSYAEDVFVHASKVDGGGPLKPGQRVEFAAEAGEKGLRAIRVVPGRQGLSPKLSAVGMLLAVLLAVEEALRRLGVGWVAALVAAEWVVTWLAYAWDKRKAGLGGRRVPESALLALAFCGGTPAALAAMLVLRHKTRKKSFQLKFAAVIVAQLALAWAWFHFRR